MDRRLDRRPSFDERSRQYPIRALIGADTKPRGYTWACDATLDQGSEGACVGFGWAHELVARPVRVALPGDDTSFALGLYRQAQQVDEWPGEDYDGTSVLAGAKVVRAAGYISEYRWAFGLEDVLLTLGYRGPVVLGVNWYEGMFDTDDAGLLHVTGEIAGGHCILANGVSVRRGLVRLHNSWGHDWGMFGDAFLSWADLDRLLHEAGDACVPIGRRLG